MSLVTFIYLRVMFGSYNALLLHIHLSISCNHYKLELQILTNDLNNDHSSHDWTQLIVHKCLVVFSNFQIIVSLHDLVTFWNIMIMSHCCIVIMAFRKKYCFKPKLSQFEISKINTITLRMRALIAIPLKSNSNYFLSYRFLT